LVTGSVAEEQFLLYDVIFHEQVNKQRRALMFFLDLAMSLKRTLVLPRTRLLRRVGRGSQFAPDAEYVAWGELFNVSALSKLHPVMELEQFVELHGSISLHIKIDHKGCPASDKPASVSFNGLDLPAQESMCAAGLQYDKRRLLAPETAHQESLAFSHSVDQLDMRRASALRAYVRFNDDIYTRASAYVERQFGGERFVAVHWRRTDFLRVRVSQPGVLQSADDVVRHVQQLQQLHGIKHVYLATDSDDAHEVVVVREALGAARYVPATPPTGLRARTEHANLEIAICAMGAYFLGTKTSSFTLAIVEERAAVFRHEPSTAAEMDSLTYARRHDAVAPPRLERDEL
jgi:hypothetical protein